MTTDIGKRATPRQLEWIQHNKPEIVAGLLGMEPELTPGAFCDWGDAPDELVYAIMHKVTEAVDRMGGVRYDCDFGWSGLIVRSGSSVGYPTRFQAELAALGAPEEVVNDG